MVTPPWISTDNRLTQIMAMETIWQWTTSTIQTLSTQPTDPPYLLQTAPTWTNNSTTCLQTPKFLPKLPKFTHH